MLIIHRTPPIYVEEPSSVGENQPSNLLRGGGIVAKNGTTTNMPTPETTTRPVRRIKWQMLRECTNLKLNLTPIQNIR